jgi:hypothetical protein
VAGGASGGCDRNKLHALSKAAAATAGAALLINERLI